MDQSALTTTLLASQRVNASAALWVASRSGRTRLARLWQDGSAKIRLPAPEDASLQAILINTASGLTGGDRIRWEADAGEGTDVVLTTQACEKAYRAGAGHASVAVRLSLREGARLAWLPQETIVFDGAALRRTIEADLAPGSRLLLAEAAIFGRRAMGETVNRAIFRDRWRIRRDGRLVHAEDLALGPGMAEQLGRGGVAGGGEAVASVLCVADDAEALLPEARALLGDAGGASFWSFAGSGKLLARVVDRDGYHLRKRLVPLLRLLNGGADLPKVWSI